MTTYYVSTTGNDAANGTSIATAWRTINRSVRASSPAVGGDTIKVLSGTYYENVVIQKSGSSDSARITLEAYDPDALPRIAGAATTSQIYVNNQSNLTIDGMAADNYRSAGIVLGADTQACHNLTVQNCRLTNQIGAATPYGQYAIRFKNRYKRYQSTNIRFLDNYMENIVTGPANNSYNEGMQISGNVRGALIEGNVLKNITYIAMDLLGADGTSVSTLEYGFPGNVIIRGNTIDTVAPNQWGGRNAIYIDRAGAQPGNGGNIVIEENYIVDAGAAINIQFENGWWSNVPQIPGNYGQQFIVRNNVSVDGVAYHGLVLGAEGSTSDATFTPRIPARMIIDHIYAVHNVSITTKNTSTPMIWAQSRYVGLKNNILMNETATGTNRIYSWSRYAVEDEWTSDGNLYYSASGTYYWEWTNGVYYSTLATIRTANGMDANSITGAPTFTDRANNDFTLNGGNGSGVGVALTTAVGAGTASRTLTVGNARYFTDGMGIQGGDHIKIDTDEAYVVAVDYTNNIITLDRDVTWANGDDVNYYWTGSGPSMGLSESVGTGAITDPVSEPTIDPDPPSGTETTAVINPSFDSGSASWNFYSAGSGSATYATAGEAAVTVVADGSNTQLYQYGISVTSGVSYTITLDSESDDANTETVFVELIEHASPYTNLGFGQSVTVPINQASQDFTFTATGTSSNARIRMQLYTGADITVYEFNMTSTSPVVGGEGGDQTLAVAAGGDDGYYYTAAGGIIDLTNATYIYAGDNDASNTDYAGIFRMALSEAIPDGATVTSAYIEVRSKGTGTGIAPMVLDMEKTSNAAAFSTYADYVGRTFTTATAAWTPAAWVSTTRYQSTDMSAVVQEVLDNASGLASGAYINVRMIDATAGWNGTQRMNYISPYEENASYAATFYVAWAIDPTAAVHNTSAIGTRTGMTTAL